MFVVRRIAAFHRNERGDMVQNIMIAAMIIIPLIIVVIAFGSRQVDNLFRGAVAVKQNSDDLASKTMK